jgi:hypothetical protein
VETLAIPLATRKPHFLVIRTIPSLLKEPNSAATFSKRSSPFPSGEHALVGLRKD